MNWKEKVRKKIFYYGLIIIEDQIINKDLTNIIQNFLNHISFLDKTNKEKIIRSDDFKTLLNNCKDQFYITILNNVVEKKLKIENYSTIIEIKTNEIFEKNNDWFYKDYNLIKGLLAIFYPSYKFEEDYRIIKITLNSYTKIFQKIYSEISINFTAKEFIYFEKKLIENGILEDYLFSKLNPETLNLRLTHFNLDISKKTIQNSISDFRYINNNDLERIKLSCKEKIIDNNNSFGIDKSIIKLFDS